MPASRVISSSARVLGHSTSDRDGRPPGNEVSGIWELMEGPDPEAEAEAKVPLLWAVLGRRKLDLLLFISEVVLVV